MDLEKSNYYKLGKKKADPLLIEKVTKALHLLEGLAQTDLKFIFKGGSALLLLLNEMYRFSIDIDILVEEEKEDADLHSILSKIVEESIVFTHFTKDIRKRNNEIPKAHYRIFYISAIDGMESYILLNFLFEKSYYAELIEKNIEYKFIE